MHGTDLIENHAVPARDPFGLDFDFTRERPRHRVESERAERPAPEIVCIGHANRVPDRRDGLPLIGPIRTTCGMSGWFALGARVYRAWISGIDAAHEIAVPGLDDAECRRSARQRGLSKAHDYVPSAIDSTRRGVHGVAACRSAKLNAVRPNPAGPASKSSQGCLIALDERNEVPLCSIRRRCRGRHRRRRRHRAGLHWRARG